MTLIPTYLTTTNQKNVHELITPSLNHYYKTPHYPLQVGRHCFEGINPLWSLLSGKAIKLFFSTSSKTQSPRFNLVPVYRGWILVTPSSLPKLRGEERWWATDLCNSSLSGPGPASNLSHFLSFYLHQQLWSPCGCDYLGITQVMSRVPEDSGVHLGWGPAVGILKSLQAIPLLFKTPAWLSLKAF